MEDVLAVYERHPDPERPLVCLDEFGKRRNIPARARQTVVGSEARREQAPAADTDGAGPE